MIDPIATIIAYLASSAAVRDVTGGRIAAKHKYALGLSDDDVAPDAWPTAAQALRVQPGAGTPDFNTRTQRLDLQVTCFGESQARAMEVYRAVVSVTRDTERTRVITGDGDALLYYLVAVGAPTFGFESIGEQIGVDVVTFTLRTAVAECPIPLPTPSRRIAWYPGMITGVVAPPTYAVAYYEVS
jgi:hypothetical protein